MARSGRLPAICNLPIALGPRSRSRSLKRRREWKTIAYGSAPRPDVSSPDVETRSSRSAFPFPFSPPIFAMDFFRSAASCAPVDICSTAVPQATCIHLALSAPNLFLSPFASIPIEIPMLVKPVLLVHEQPCVEPLIVLAAAPAPRCRSNLLVVDPLVGREAAGPAGSGHPVRQLEQPPVGVVRVPACS